MGALDAPMAKVAATLTKRFGRPATLERPATGGTYDAETDTSTWQYAPRSYPCSVVFAEFSESQIDGTLVQLGDRKAIVARSTLGVQPVPEQDTLLEGGRTWRIVRFLGYSSGESEAAYELHVRR